ncbi:NUDIX hydrolase [Microbacterium panaciterrae]|uniref:Nudix hydrolase domain-containing protein n=1 Tax=Microbacterium panaciterrae TaxID=985759 RepID=A0ABP8PAJ6_9MICO
MNARSFAVVPAAYVYLRHEDRVLLQLRQNTGFMDGRWAAAIAGHVELGETALATACREAVEELGIMLHPGALTPVTAMQRTDGTADPREQRVDWFFTARVWDGRPTIKEPLKCADLAWFRLTDLPDLVPPHERLVLDGLASGRLSVFTSYGY